MLDAARVAKDTRGERPLGIKREPRAVPSTVVREGAALCKAKEISAAKGRKSCRVAVGSWSQ